MQLAGMIVNTRLCCLIFSVLSLTQCAFSQLTAVITSAGNYLIATISITNPTLDPIWILAWNNAFDSARLPVLFSVQDDLGNDVQLASTYVFRAGMSDSDFFLLAPGQSYSRTIYLRQIMQNVPSGPSTPSGYHLRPKVFTIRPPRSFKGVIGNLSIPAEAAADLAGNPETLGDFEAAALRDIVVYYKPRKFQAVFPMVAAGNIDPSFTSNPDGIHVDIDCAAQNLTASSDAMFDAGIYARSLGMAANDTSSSLFPLFFPETSRQAVSRVARAAANSINGTGPHVDLYCTDLENLCTDPNVLGYSFTPSFIGNSYIVLCSSATRLGRAPLPCPTPEPGYQRSASVSHVMIHLLMTLNNVVTTMIENSIYGASACERLSDSILIDATKNADSYAQLAIAHWSYGLGGSPYDGASCLITGSSLPHLQDRAVSAERKQHQRSPEPLPGAEPVNPPNQHFKRDSMMDELRKTKDCSAAELDLLNFALTSARALAQHASDDLSGPESAASTNRWTTIFNGDDTVEKQVKAVYDAVAKWNTSAPYATDVGFRCDPTRQSLFCKGNHNAVAPSGRIRGQYFAFIVACPYLFYQAISLECVNPINLPIYLKEVSALDMGATIMHELLHIDTVINTRKQIKDGSPSCYKWNCLTQNAHDRVLPGFSTQNLPENVAVNYQFFAASARASRGDCSWTGYAGSAYGAIVTSHKSVGADIYHALFGG